MDKQLEQRIRDRAFELWMQNGCLPDRSEEYWYQAEREVLAEAGPSSDDAASGLGDEDSTLRLGTPSDSSSDNPPVETSSTPLGMTSETQDELGLETGGALNVPPKARRRRATLGAPEGETSAPELSAGASVPEVPKRRRGARTPSS